MIHSKKFGIEKYMEEGVHEIPNNLAELYLIYVYKYFIGEKIYSHVALHYQIIYNKQKAIELLKILKKNKPIFVGGEHNSKEILNQLLGTENFIKTLSKNTYKTIDKIETKIIKELNKSNNKYEIIVFSCGLTSKALIKRLYLFYNNKKVFYFDMGSIVELFNGKTMWTWVKKSGID